jgi:hypothetical protein
MATHLDLHPGDKGTGVSTAAAATLNNCAGTITTEALATVAAAFYTFVLTNSLIQADSVVMVSVSSGTNTTQGLLVHEVTPVAGSATIKIKNNAAVALNGTIIIAYHVVT